MVELQQITNRLYRVKLPKSFLSVNLSETHTFHKKEEQETQPDSTAFIAPKEPETPGHDDKFFDAEEIQDVSSGTATGALPSNPSSSSSGDAKEAKD